MNYEKHLSQLQSFSLPEGKLAYIDEGEGPALLLVHGIPTSSWLYRHMIPMLKEKGYRVIAPDLLGFGASSKPKGYEIYSEEAQGTRLLQLMSHLQINEWVQVFHDGGGLWTWEMLQQDASRVKGLVILNTIIYDTGFFPPMRFEPSLWARFYTRLYSLGLTNKLMVNATLNNGLMDLSKLSKEDCEGYQKPLRKSGHRGLYYFFTQTCNRLPADYHELLAGLNKPAKIIWGTNDKILVWEKMADEVSTDLKVQESNIHLIDKGKHFIQEEAPQQIVDLIEEFMKKEF